MIQDEVNPIRERIKNFSANNIWNADETAIFIAILSTEKETILKAWEKTNIKADFDFDRELENQDVEEEFFLQIRMDELMINDEDEATEEDSERWASLGSSCDRRREKRIKQSQKKKSS